MISGKNQNQKSLFQKVYNQLRDDITSGKFKPGEHLSEKFLTQEYGVSRASIREVIGRLATQVYLTFKPNQGVVVTRLSLEDINVTYNILIRCESYATAYFVKHQNRAVIEKLEFLHKKMQAQNVKFKYKIWIQLNEKFHELIYSNCGSTMLADLIHNMRLRIYRYRIVETDPKIIATYNEQHNKILKAINESNERLAESLMKNHLETARKHRFEVLKEFAEII